MLITKYLFQKFTFQTLISLCRKTIDFTGMKPRWSNLTLITDVNRSHFSQTSIQLKIRCPIFKLHSTIRFNISCSNFVIMYIVMNSKQCRIVVTTATVNSLKFVANYLLYYIWMAASNIEPNFRAWTIFIWLSDLNWSKREMWMLG